MGSMRCHVAAPTDKRARERWPLGSKMSFKGSSLETSCDSVGNSSGTTGLKGSGSRSNIGTAVLMAPSPHDVFARALYAQGPPPPTDRQLQRFLWASNLEGHPGFTTTHLCCILRARASARTTLS